MVPPVVRVVPESEGHGREGRPADQLAPCPGSDGRTALVDDVHVHAQHRALDLACVDRSRRLATDEAATQVGTAGDRRQVDVRLPVGVDVGEALGAERATGGADGPQRAEVVGPRRTQSGLGHRVDELGRHAEQRHVTVVHEVEQPGAIRVEGRAVVEDQRGSGGQARGQPVPHHPASRREVEDPVAGPDVALEPVLHQVLEEDSAGPVHDALGPSGRSGRVQDVERVVERQVQEPDRPGVVRVQERVEGDSATWQRPVGGLSRVATNYHYPAEGGQSGGHVGQPGGDVVVATPVVVAVGGEQHDRFDLAEPVQHAIGSEVGRGGGEHGADRGRGQHDGVRLGDVREPRRHPVAWLHPEVQECLLESRDQVVEVLPGEFPARAVLAPEHKCWRVVGVGQEVFGEVQVAVREEAGAGGVVADRLDRSVARVAHHAQVVPCRAPEVARMVHRPAVEVPVATLDADRHPELLDLARGSAMHVGRPDGGGHGP